MSSRPVVTPLDPSGYRRTPWKNGGGSALDIAEGFIEGTAERNWGTMLWRFGRTTIAAPGPFSDLGRFTRMQVVVEGHGLVLETAEGEIDLRRPLQPVRYAGGLRIVSRLEAGPVDVINLMGDSTRTRIDLAVLRPAAKLTLRAGTHIVYAAEACALDFAGSAHALAPNHALRLDLQEEAAIEGRAGRALVGSVLRA